MENRFIPGMVIHHQIYATAQDVSQLAAQARNPKCHIGSIGFNIQINIAALLRIINTSRIATQRLPRQDAGQVGACT